MRKTGLLLVVMLIILAICSFSKNIFAMACEGEAEKACDYNYHEWFYPAEDFDLMKCVAGCYSLETNARTDAKRICCWDDDDGNLEEQCYFFLDDYFAFYDELYEISDVGNFAVFMIQ